MPTAMLVPVEDAGTFKPSHQEIVEGLRDLRAQVESTGISVREMIEE